MEKERWGWKGRRVVRGGEGWGVVWWGAEFRVVDNSLAVSA